MKVNILGTKYEIIKQSAKDNEILDDCNGYCDWTTSKIYIRDYTVDTDVVEYKDVTNHINKTIRHEIVHAFLCESGLWSNSIQPKCGWAMNEEMVDWIAMQFPKMLKVFQEAECI